ncbi:Metallophosphoesterase [Planctomycetales bacterium 10988]|nr:Metallophosphoesterase [Planctomycetales bacterium 10988]
MTRRRTIAIGDIHGCILALRALLARINPQPDDLLVFLGDYIDRGPDSRSVISELIELRRSGTCRVVTIMGNHEEMMLSAVPYFGQNDWHYWMDAGGKQTLASYDNEAENIPTDHLEFIFSCARYYETPTHLFTHGCYEPDLNMDEQSDYELRWVSLRERIPGRHRSGKQAILGHTSQKDGEVLDLGHLVCIDTFCYGGGWLTALEVHTQEVWQFDREGNPRV